ncbi:MAG: DUF883 C-terminal domain-containing protein [Methyloceanibacter sp.]
MTPKWQPGKRSARKWTKSRRTWPDCARTSREDLKWLADDVKRLGSHQVEDMQAAAAAALDELVGTVRRNPLAAVGIALGAGFIYGVLTRR